MTQQVLVDLFGLLDCGSGCGVTAGGRNGAGEGNMATAEGLIDF